MTEHTWPDLTPGRTINVVKLAPDGAEAARYAGEVVARVAVESWVVVRATWVYRPIALDGLEFQPGDQLLEWFSPERFFNAFAVFTPQQQLRGWYANVTLPAYLRAEAPDNRPLLVWHDLYLDLVGLPNGDYRMRDEDELAASGLAERDLQCYRAVVSAGAELARRFVARHAPFLPDHELIPLLQVPLGDAGGNRDESGTSTNFVHPH